MIVRLPLPKQERGVASHLKCGVIIASPGLLRKECETVFKSRENLSTARIVAPTVSDDPGGSGA
jgi:hypothetical protein